MKIFGGKNRDKKPDHAAQRQDARERVENARELQYLQRLTTLFQEGTPSYSKRLHDMEKKANGEQLHAAPSAPPSRPVTPAPKAEPAPQPARRSREIPEDELPLSLVKASTNDPFIALPSDEIEASEFSYGDIVLLSDGSLAIYNRAIPEKEYDVVYMLRDTGALTPLGIPLGGHGAQVIGRLSAAATRKAFSDYSWNREMIVFHLYEYGDVELVPEIKAPPKKIHHATETPEHEHRSPLVRGREFSVAFGERKWEGIYWGHDEQGALVAHNTTGEWALMHLDLKRFEGSIEYGDIVKPAKMADIEAELIAASSRHEDAG